MAEFTENLQSFKNSLPYLYMDSNLELMSQFGEISSSVLESPSLGLHSFLGFSNECSSVQQQPQFPINFANNLQVLLNSDAENAIPVVQSMDSAEDFVTDESNKRRKATPVSDSSSGNSSTPVLEIGFAGDSTKNKRKNNSGRGKKAKDNAKQVEKPREVIHVRARRGQATDSHSLAERVRREKINERLKCLQHLVPGCYKTMGMAVMLDEIINYVQSLQNQVEFLSMKLTAASSYYDFNLDTDQPPQTMQGTNAYEAHEMERLREGYGGLTFPHSTWPL